MYLLSVSEKIFFFVCGLGILQGILLALLIYFKPKSDRSVNIFLALYIFCTSFIMSLPLLIQIIGWRNSFIVLQIPLLSGPLLYLYVRSFKESISWRKVFPHLIPFFLFSIFSYLNLSSASNKYPDAKEVPREFLNSPLTLVITYAKPLQQILYYFLSRKELLSYQRAILHLFSETRRINLNWAKFLVNGYLILVSTFVVVFPLLLLLLVWKVVPAIRWVE